MASYLALSAAAKSVVDVLGACFREEQPLGATRPCTAAVVRTTDFELADGTGIPDTGVSIFVYRVDVNETTRAAWSAVGGEEGRSQLPLDLHFLLTPWASNAEDELKVLGRAMQCLEDVPVFAGPLLDPAGEWEAGEAVQVVPGRITTEEVMRTFDSLPHDYKLSVPYVARVIRLSGRRLHREPAVTAATAVVVPRVSP